MAKKKPPGDRPPEPLPTRADYFKIHDADLAARAKTDPLAADVQKAPGDAASCLRLVLASVCGEHVGTDCV